MGQDRTGQDRMGRDRTKGGRNLQGLPKGRTDPAPVDLPPDCIMRRPVSGHTGLALQMDWRKALAQVHLADREGLENAKGLKVPEGTEGLDLPRRGPNEQAMRRGSLPLPALHYVACSGL